jgi:hypothetical protein
MKIIHFLLMRIKIYYLIFYPMMNWIQMLYCLIIFYVIIMI